MKKIIKLFGIIAFIAVIGFTMIACNKSGGSSSGGGKTLNSPEALKEYLDKQPANSPDKPIKVSMTINDPMLKSVVDVIKSAGKYVSLNITGNALTEIPIFDNCETLAGITIPVSVTSINEDAFIRCVNITAINVDAANSTYSSQDGVLYNKDKTNLFMYPRGKAGAFTIPSSVTSILDYAFRSCSNLTDITIPSSVTSIEYGAFSGSGITSVVIPNSVNQIDHLAFTNTKLTSVTFQGLIDQKNLGSRGHGDWYTAFSGDLEDKYLAGGIGTYTRPNSDSKTWTKQ